MSHRRNSTSSWKLNEDEQGFGAKGDRNHAIDPKLWCDLYNQVRSAKFEAVYIDVDEDPAEQEDENHVYSKWCDLPDLLLEEIFSYLTIRQKYYASLVCRSWYRAFHLPYVWSRFVLEDSTLTRGRFNYYSGWQYVLDHLRTSMCLSSVGRNFKHLTFEPMLNFYNLYEFMNMVSWYIEQSKNAPQPENEGVGNKIRSLKFTFPCDMSTRESEERIRLFGTGGKLLAALKRLMANLQELKTLELIDLMLDAKEAEHLLDEVCEICCLTLRHLMLVNTTRVQYTILHVGVFLNLETLKISPQNLGKDLVELIGYTNLKHLHVVQNRYSPDDVYIETNMLKAWKQCRQNNKNLKVHLELESKKHKSLFWQVGAPVKSIIYHSPSIGVENESVMSIIDLYRNDLLVYGHTRLPRGYRPKSFYDRIDCTVLLLCRQCPNLKVLVITERISTATVLLLAQTAKKLRYLHVRGNAVVKKCDWPRSPDWSNEFYDWLKINSKTSRDTEKEVSNILGYPWHLLTDKEFKQICVDLHGKKLYV